MKYRPFVYRWLMHKTSCLLEDLAYWIDRFAGVLEWEAREPGEE
jgi:hypothetical protein